MVRHNEEYLSNFSQWMPRKSCFSFTVVGITIDRAPLRKKLLLTAPVIALVKSSTLNLQRVVSPLLEICICNLKQKLFNYLLWSSVVSDSDTINYILLFDWFCRVELFCCHENVTKTGWYSISRKRADQNFRF